MIATKKTGLLAWSILTLLIACVSTSCRTSKKSPDGSQEYAATGGSMSGKEAKRHLEAITALGDAKSGWQKVNVPVSAKVSGVALSLSGSAVMERGKSIYVSLRLLGMEVAFASVTTDSILIVDKAHGRYASAPLSAVTATVPVTIDNLQQIITGQAFTIGGGEITASTQHLALNVADDNSGGWTISPEATRLFSYFFTFSNTDLLERLTVETSGDRRATIDYSDDWTTTDFGSFPSRLDASVPTGKGALSATLKFSYKKAKWNGDVTPPFPSVPRSCERIDAKNLLRILESL